MRMLERLFHLYPLPHHGLHLGPGAGGGEPVGGGLSDHQPDPSAGADDLLYPAQHEKRHQRRPGAVHRPHRAAELRHRPGGGRRADAGGDRHPRHLPGHPGPADHRRADGLEGKGGHAHRHRGHDAAGLSTGGHPGAGVHEHLSVRPAPPAAVPGFRRRAVPGGDASGHRRGHVYHVPVLRYAGGPSSALQTREICWTKREGWAVTAGA